MTNNSTPKEIIKARVLKKMEELKMELTLQRQFFDRLINGKIKIKKSDYKGYKWYYDATDKVTGVNHYDFIEK